MFVTKTKNAVLWYHQAYPQACKFYSASELVEMRWWMWTTLLILLCWITR